MGKHYLGLISGTSTDGVDAAIASFTGHRCRLVAARTTPYSQDLEQRVHALITTANAPLRDIGALDVALGRFFGTCAAELIREAGLAPDDIEAIGHHGQTVFHAPESVEPFSMQLGDPNVVAAVTGVTTVADFRRRDIAHGGQGAPLVPAFHDWLFRADTETRAVVNIGGISNVTLLKPQHATVGFDTGPGNTLLDAWIQRSRSLPFDRDGLWSAAGTVDAGLLAAFMREPYFAVAPPKSTGRELFNLAWLERHLTAGRHKPEDVQATLAELTAATIVAALRTLDDGYRLLVCGGGAYNQDLLARLARLSGREAQSTSAYGIDPDWVEAAAFAWLARARLNGVSGNVPSVTGARHAAVLGGVYYGGEPETTSQQSRSARGHPEPQTA